MEDKDKLDDFFRERMVAAEVSPDEGTWESIESQLGEDRKRPVLWWWGIAAGVVLLIGLGTIWWVGQKVESLEGEVAEMRQEIETIDRPESSEHPAGTIHDAEQDGQEEQDGGHPMLGSEENLENRGDGESVEADGLLEKRVQTYQQGVAKSAQDVKSADSTEGDGLHIDDPQRTDGDGARQTASLIEEEMGSGSGILDSTDDPPTAELGTAVRSEGQVSEQADLEAHSAAKDSDDAVAVQVDRDSGSHPPSDGIISGSDGATTDEKGSSGTDLSVLDQESDDRIPTDQWTPMTPLTWSGMDEDTMNEDIRTDASLFRPRDDNRSDLLAYGLYGTSFRRLVANGVEAESRRSTIDAAERAEHAFGVGAMMGRRIGGSWHLMLGAEYSRQGQSGEYQLPVTIEASDVATVFEEVTPFQEELEVEGSLGITQLIVSGSIENPPITTGDPTGLPMDTSFVIPYQRHELTEWFSIPLLLEYRLKSGDWEALIGGGFSYDLLIQQNTRNELSDGFQLGVVSQTELKRSFFSAHAQVGLHYSLSRRLGLMVGLRYKSWLTPIHDSDGLKSYPYSATGIGGFRIEF